MELDILMWIQEMHTPIFDIFFPAVTSLGNAGIFWIIAGVVLLATKAKRREGILLLFTLFICFLIGNVFLKNIVMRERPCWRYPEIELLLTIPKDYSFPSGHSMISFAAALALYYTDKRVGICALCLAATIAFSRLYLFVHWPSDVVIGSAIGLLVAWVVFHLSKKL